MRPRMFVARCCCGVTPPNVITPAIATVTAGNWTPINTYFNLFSDLLGFPAIGPPPCFGFFPAPTLPTSTVIEFNGYVLFQMNTIPVGATVVSAILSVHVGPTRIPSWQIASDSVPPADPIGGSQNARCRIHLTDEDAASQPFSAAQCNARPLTTAFVNHTIAYRQYESSPGNTHQVITFGDIAPPVQEVVNRPGFNGSSLMVMFITDTSDYPFGARFYEASGRPDVPGWLPFQIWNLEVTIA